MTDSIHPTAALRGEPEAAGRDRDTTAPKMNKWAPESNPMVLRRVGKTGEECAELSKVCSRITIQGLRGIDPENGLLNIEALAREVADVMAQCQVTIEALGLPVKFIEGRAAKKRALMAEWEALFSAPAETPKAASGCSHTARSDGQNGVEQGATPPAPAALKCGHHKSLMLLSAETRQPLYCELCDAISGRRDAELMEAELRAKLTALAASPQPAAPVEDLAMMIRMLVSSLKRHWLLAPQPNDLPSRAMELLRRHGLQGSPLREADDGAPKQPAPAAEGDAS